MTASELTTASPCYATARKAMIDCQLRPSGVNSAPVLARMAGVAREDFVPAAQRPFAYMDRAIPLGGGDFLPAPLVQGLMLQEAAPRGSEQALVVDCGAGYLAHLVRPMVAGLTVISPAQALLAGADEPLADLLLVDGAAQALPQALLDRLAPGALIVTGLIDNGVSRLAVGRKGESGAALMNMADIGIPEMAALRKPRVWSF